MVPHATKGRWNMAFRARNRREVRWCWGREIRAQRKENVVDQRAALPGTRWAVTKGRAISKQQRWDVSGAVMAAWTGE